MIGFSAFKTQKPRSFDYRPRFYNPEQEAREARRRELLGDDAASVKESPAAGSESAQQEYKPGQYIGQLRIRRGVIADRQVQAQRSNKIRVAIIVVLVGALCAYIFG